ncbi:MAG: homoserine dehydrogenase [Azospirillum sp.]|nr:homoserine dehydrogenase [Azospirillum sp.]
MDPLRIAIAGLGTVGAATVRLLHDNAALIQARCGRRLDIVAVSARDPRKDRGVDLSGIAWFEDAAAMAAAPDIDVVVELIGGSAGTAREVCQTALAHGRHVVTANKALLAHHGTELVRLAEQRGLTIGFEAAVAGGIPVIKGLREGLAGNRIAEVHGILNGTCNYILSEMRQTGRSFADVLADAQRLGYAEADPGFDIDGIDAAHKLAILTSVAFGVAIDFESVHVEGIRHISADDIKYAGGLKYRIKLMGIARRGEDGVEQRVHPCMIPEGASMAAVEGVFNAVVAQGDFVDKVAMIGRGAGAGPTASAVSADLVDIARNRQTPAFTVTADRLTQSAPVPIERRFGAYYLRLMVDDRVGVLRGIAGALADAGVSIATFFQDHRAPGEPVPVVMTTHETFEAAMLRGLDAIRSQDFVHDHCMIRIEQF